MRGPRGQTQGQAMTAFEWGCLIALVIWIYLVAYVIKR